MSQSGRIHDKEAVGVIVVHGVPTPHRHDKEAVGVIVVHGVPTDACTDVKSQDQSMSPSFEGFNQNHLYLDNLLFMVSCA